MGKKIAVVLMVLGGVLFFFIGLPVIAIGLLNPPPELSTFFLAIIFAVCLFIIIPVWMMYYGFSKYRSEVHVEKERKAMEMQKRQIEKELRALELERIKQQREKIAKGETDLEKPSVIREREIIKEIVKIKCRYCGRLYDQRLDRCPHCGAST